jgi:SAM-dependent methyltransferase
VNGHRLYVQYGCGFSSATGWQNFDNSPTLRIERMPIVGIAISAYWSGNKERFPKNVRYGDIVKGLPVVEHSASGCYASHVLEHLSLNDMRTALRNTAKILKPGGIFRMVVPDLLERARIYITSAAEGDPLASHKFLQSSYLGLERRPQNPFQFLRLAFGNSHHLWMWDEYSLAAELLAAGFHKIRRCELGDSPDPMFNHVEQRSRFFDDELQIKECALEARIPL